MGEPSPEFMCAARQYSSMSLFVGMMSCEKLVSRVRRQNTRIAPSFVDVPGAYDEVNQVVS